MQNRSLNQLKSLLPGDNFGQFRILRHVVDGGVEHVFEVEHTRAGTSYVFTVAPAEAADGVVAGVSAWRRWLPWVVAMGLAFLCLALGVVTAALIWRPVDRQPAGLPPASHKALAKAAVPAPTSWPATGPVPGRDWQIPDIGMQFVWLAEMGCWGGKYEVTNSDYRQWKPGHAVPLWKGQRLDRDRQPVCGIAVEDMLAFAEWLTLAGVAAGQLPEGSAYCLPTGQEWEAMATCGTGRIYPWGNDWPPTQGNYCGEETVGGGSWSMVAGYNDGFEVSSPVEQSGVNPWGLHGIGGNVWEATLSPVGTFEAWRGASWIDCGRVSLRCDYRERTSNVSRFPIYGFRLLLKLPEK